MIDTNIVLVAHLKADAGVAALVGTRVYCPRLPQGADLPAIGLFTRGGLSTPYIPGYLNPSVQIDCWAHDHIEARSIYRAVYDALQGIQNVTVTIGTTDYFILSAEEEVQGQDLVDIEIPNYFRVLTFFSIIVR